MQAEDIISWVKEKMMELGGNECKFNYSEIEDIWFIIMALSDSTFSSIDASVGKKGRYWISCEAMMSAMNTIVTIDFCCHRGAYSDAYTMVRKYRDDLMQYLFVLNVIKNMQGLTEEEIKDISFDAESFIKMIELDFQILISGERKSDAELAMESWMYNDLELTEHSEMRKRFFDTSKYKNFLMSADKSIDYMMKNYLNTAWKKEDRKLNNYVHGNGLKYLTDNYAYQINKGKKDKELIETLQNITDIFLSLLALIDSVKMHSSDYLDAMDMGVQPEDGSQYWVCSSIVEYMNRRFDKDLLSYIQKNEKNGMKFMLQDYRND